MSQGNVIKPKNLPEQIRKERGSLQMSQGLSLKNLALVEKSLINDVIGETNGNLKKAADILGISRGTLYSKMKKFGIRKSQKQ